MQEVLWGYMSRLHSCDDARTLGGTARQPAPGLLSWWDDNRETQILGMGA
jgi:hypothetical protein